MTETPSTTTKVYRKIWGYMLMVGLIVEAFTLPHGHRDTLSETVWDTVRWTNWRLLFLPAWTWLTWHWVLRKEQTLDYKDLIAVAIGLIWAIIEILRK
jgi:hypothetical protein